MRKKVNGWKPLTIIAKNILDVWLSSESASDIPDLSSFQYLPWFSRIWIIRTHPEFSFFEVAYFLHFPKAYIPWFKEVLLHLLPGSHSRFTEHLSTSPRSWTSSSFGSLLTSTTLKYEDWAYLFLTGRWKQSMTSFLH